MRKKVSIILFLSFCFMIQNVTAESREYMPLTGIYWDDSLEAVQALYGKGTVTTSNNKAILKYDDQKFAGYEDVDYKLVFSDNQLKSIWFLVSGPIMTGFEETFLNYFIDAYGDPLRTDYESILDRSFRENTDDKYYLWFLEDDTILYLYVNPSIVKVTLEQYIK